MTEPALPNNAAPPGLPSKLTVSTAWIVMINLPFVIGHPHFELAGWPFAQSFAINLVLFWAPGWACLVPSVSRRQSDILLPIGVLLISVAAFLGILGSVQLSGRAVSARTVWNATWLVTNLLLAIRLWKLDHSFRLPSITDRSLMVAVVLFAASYTLYYVGATQVVPPQADHDFEVQGTGASLLKRMEPLLLTDRGTHYYFAHPPLLHFYVAASFLYFGESEHLQTYDTVSRRVRAAKRDEDIESLRKTVGDYRVLGRQKADYLLQSAEGNVVRAPVELVELEYIEDYYATSPHRLETRTPTIFLAAVTVALFGWWASRLTGHWGWGLLAGAAYAASPEVFVRSSYGGYFGISNFAVLLILWTANSWNNRQRRQDWVACGLAGLFAAIANHKLILLPTALAAFEFCRQVVSRRQRLKASAFLHPALTGFFVGTSIFWIYGLLISPTEFWTEHVRTHLIDRVAHINPLGYTGYPTMFGLWKEFVAHTGYILAAVAGVTLLVGTLRRSSDGASVGQDSVSTTTIRSWLVWIILTAVVFTMVDWRMTKHLMVLMVPLFLVPVIYVPRSLVLRGILGVVLSVTLCWNLFMLQRLVTDFSSFQVSPGW